MEPIIHSILKFIHGSQTCTKPLTHIPKKSLISAFVTHYMSNIFRPDPPHVLCVDTGRSSETAKAHRG
eukprot:TRINITY_DN3024_c0_g1_i1.p1 TRINITY_DN3024_c0_g1~~TRINITY_DN3024_c0_g1_i1.p1  ORF type:complete len:68 (+),score=7.74 TRINITY_DN3024_c0_g1_i1:200-403(+)